MDGSVLPARPWTAVPRLPRRRRLVDVLYVFYATAVITVLWVGIAADPLRSVVASVPRDDRAAVVAWPLLASLVLALASGVAGGPWVLRCGTATWVVPGRAGPVVLTRALLTLVAIAASGGGLLGWIAVVVSEDGPAALVGIAVGALVGAACVAVAALAQPADVVARAGAAASAAGLGVLGTASLVAGALDAGPALLLGIGVVGAALAAGASRAGRVRVDRLDRRARALAPLAVVLADRDLRSLTLLARSLTGERPRRVAGRRHAGRRGALLTRATASLRRSSPRRAIRWALLVGASCWGWWLLWLGTPVGAAPVALGAWLLGLDLAEPLAQEEDRPSLVPRPTGRGLVVHALVVVVPAGVLLAAPAVLLAPLVGAGLAARTAVVVVPGLALATAAGAVHALVRPPTQVGAIVLPEALLSSLVLREGLPSALAALGLVPLLAHERLRDGSVPVAAGVAGPVLGAVAVAVVIAAAVVRGARSRRVRRVEEVAP